jgi:acetolactate synthase-1/3 small subunit
MRHTISVLVENKFGALARIAGLFSGRGYNIESLTVGPTQDQTMSKMTIVTSGDDSVLEQIEKQLNKLVEVVSVKDLTGSGYVARELMLIKVKANCANRSEITSVAAVFKANVVNISLSTMVLEVTGPSAKLDAFIQLMHPFGIIELARTGTVALARTDEPTELLEPPVLPPSAEPQPVNDMQ